MKKISVIICTHNRAELLAGAIHSLHEQDLPASQFKIVIVDNGSTDRTKEVARPCCEQHTVIYIHEPEVGLSYARNTGMKSAGTKYVAFIDDDARAENDWLSRILHAFESVTPMPQVVGGPIFPYYSQTPPGWFKDEYETRTWGDDERFLQPGEAFSGSNMAFQWELVLELGCFPVEYGMSGKKLSMGEETFLFQKIWNEGAGAVHIYYSPGIKVSHYVPPGKMRVRYCLKRNFIHGTVWAQQSGPRSVRGKTAWLLLTPLEVVRQLVIALLKINKYVHWQQWVVESFSPLARRLGSATGILK